VGQATTEKREIAVKEKEERERSEAKDKVSLITVRGTYLITRTVRTKYVKREPCHKDAYFRREYALIDRLCGLIVRVLGYRPGGPGSIPGTIIKKPSGSGTGFTQPREYN
jgi:hypothetical protein